MRDLPKGQSENALQARTVHGKEYLIFLKTPSFVLCSLGMTCMTFAMGGIAMWMPYYLEHRPGAEREFLLLDEVQRGDGERQFEDRLHRRMRGRVRIAVHCGVRQRARPETLP
jgi:hypothetical protein